MKSIGCAFAVLLVMLVLPAMLEASTDEFASVPCFLLLTKLSQFC
jgi:hypothetical protein